MKWKKGRRSSHMEDRRGRRMGRLPMGKMGAGGGVGIIVILLLVVVMGGDPSQLLQGIGESAAPGVPSPAEGTDEAADFVSTILASTEDTWSAIFADNGATYPPPTLVLFSDVVRSACGMNSATTGPFYCPLDRKLYIDLGFFHELARMGGAGDFARAYVIGHEVGHHVQNVAGTMDQVRELQRRGGQTEANRLSVLQELQADCYAGIWAYHLPRETPIRLDRGDVGEGLAAAAAIGDDRLMRRAGRAASPESFTHGTSAQRQNWLRRGLDTGSLGACDTFAAER